MGGQEELAHSQASASQPRPSEARGLLGYCHPVPLMLPLPTWPQEPHDTAKLPPPRGYRLGGMDSRAAPVVRDASSGARALDLAPHMHCSLGQALSLWIVTAWGQAHSMCSVCGSHCYGRLLSWRFGRPDAGSWSLGPGSLSPRPDAQQGWLATAHGLRPPQSRRIPAHSCLPTGHKV